MYAALTNKTKLQKLEAPDPGFGQGDEEEGVSKLRLSPVSADALSAAHGRNDARELRFDENPAATSATDTHRRGGSVEPI